MSARKYNGGSVASSLSGAITSSATAVSVADASTWPLTGAFSIVIDRGLAGEEKCLVGSRAGNALTITTRGYDGTTGAAHSNAAVVECCGTATDFQEANDHINNGTDLLTTDLHHTLGASPLQAAPGDVFTRYHASFAPPVTAAQVTGLNVLNQSLVGSGAVSLFPGDYSMTTGATNNSSVLGWFGGGLAGLVSAISKGHVDLTIRGRLSAGSGNAGYFTFGVADSGATNPFTTVNSCGMMVDTATGAVTGYKRVASVTTSTATLVTLGTLTDMMTLRLVYPTAGGTAQFWVNGTNVGSLATTPSMGTLASSSWTPMEWVLHNSSATSISFSIFQALLTES